MDIINADHYNFFDPHGYCRIIISDNKNRFLVPLKRRNLGDEIQELHIINDSNLIPPSTSGYFEKNLICKFIDDILAAQRPVTCQIESVRRKLFLPSRSVPRKGRTPHKNNTTQAHLFRFRKTQNHTILRKIKKNYLDEARQNVLSEVAYEQFAYKRGLSPSSSRDSSYSASAKRLRMSFDECSDQFFATPSLDDTMLVETDTEMIPIDPSNLSWACDYHGNMVRTKYEQVTSNLSTEESRLSQRVSKVAGIKLEEQYHERTKSNNKIVEESIRSIHYVKSLLDMLMERV